MPIRSRTITLDGDYEGWWLKIRSNLPLDVWGEAYQKVQDITYEDGGGGDWIVRYAFACKNLIAVSLLDWNFVDEDGEPIPATSAGTDKLNFELIREVMRRLNASETAEEGAELAGDVPLDAPNA